MADEVRQVGAAASAERARDGLGRLVEFQMVLVFVWPGLEKLGGWDPRRRVRGNGCAVAGFDSGGCGNGLELAGHHARGHADPGWEYGACGSTAVVAVVCGDHGEGDLAVREGVEWTFGAGGDLDSVTDGATITTAVEDERVIWQHC